MAGIVYPEFPLISNVEFMCMKLFERGPTHRNDLIREFWTWRKDETHFNYYELFSLCGDSYIPARLKRHQLNFVISILPKRKGRIITLSGRGYMTVARAMQRIACMKDLTARPRTYYVYYKKVGILERDPNADLHDGYGHHHFEWTTPTTFKRTTVEAKTMLEARKLVNTSLFSNEDYHHCLTSTRDLSNAFLLRNHNWPNKCLCEACLSKKGKKL